MIATAVARRRVRHVVALGSTSVSASVTLYVPPPPPPDRPSGSPGEYRAAPPPSPPTSPSTVDAYDDLLVLAALEALL